MTDKTKKLSDDRISKLRELADRGIDGEKDNARRILEKFGVDWKKPKETFADKVKAAVKVDIKEFRFKMTYPTDPLLLLKLVRLFTKQKNPKIWVEHNSIIINATKSQIKDIGHVFSTKKENFFNRMSNESDQYIDSYLR